MSVAFLLACNVLQLCVCGGLVAITCPIALKLIDGIAVEFSTETTITQNCCYAQCFLLVNFKLK